MPPRMMTRSAGRHDATSRGGMVRWQVGGQGREVNDCVIGIPTSLPIIGHNSCKITFRYCSTKLVARFWSWDGGVVSLPSLGSKDGVSLGYDGWWGSTKSKVPQLGMSWDNFKAYNDRFHELDRLFPFSNPIRRIKRYVYGLALQIRWMVAATKLSTIQKVVQIAGTLTDKALRNGSTKKNPEKREEWGIT
ncbi:hypothetical protein Tco_0116548 [Tanacetum coccineum]